MYSLFNLKPGFGLGTVRAHEWGNAKLILAENLRRVIGYHHNHSIPVKSDHLLVRILQSITVSQSLEPDRYYENVCNVSMNLSMTLKITSSIFQGGMHRGVFSSSDDDEILIAHEESLDPYWASANWKNLVPCKFLRHPRSDLGLNLPDGTNTGVENGLVVVTIDIPKLALMYRAFRLEENARSNGDSQRSLMHFIHMYVLSNMLESWCDYALFNRFVCLKQGEPIGASTEKHPFALLPVDQRVNTAYNSLIKVFSKWNRSFTGYLRNIPCMTTGNMDSFLQLPDIAPTRQVYWALLITRLPAIRLMLYLARDGVGKMNGSELNTIRKTLVQIRNDSIMRAVLRGEAYVRVMSDLSEIEALIQ